MVFWGLLSVEREEKRLIKHSRTASQTLRLRYRPNNVQRAPWCTISRSALISFFFVSPFTSDSLCFFSAPRLFFKAWFRTSQEVGETSESTLIYPNEWLSNSAHPSGTDTIPESKEEQERGGTDGERGVREKKKREGKRPIAEVWEDGSKGEEMRVCVWLT